MARGERRELQWPRRRRGQRLPAACRRLALAARAPPLAGELAAVSGPGQEDRRTAGGYARRRRLHDPGPRGAGGHAAGRSGVRSLRAGDRAQTSAAPGAGRHRRQKPRGVLGSAARSGACRHAIPCRCADHGPHSPRPARRTRLRQAQEAAPLQRRHPAWHPEPHHPPQPTPRGPVLQERGALHHPRRDRQESSRACGACLSTPTPCRGCA